MSTIESLIIELNQLCTRYIAYMDEFKESDRIKEVFTAIKNQGYNVVIPVLEPDSPDSELLSDEGRHNLEKWAEIRKKKIAKNSSAAFRLCLFADCFFFPIFSPTYIVKKKPKFYNYFCRVCRFLRNFDSSSGNGLSSDKVSPVLGCLKKSLWACRKTLGKSFRSSFETLRPAYKKSLKIGLFIYFKWTLI